MANPYRAMCAELVEALHEHTCLYEGHESELITCARALLAQPVAEGPTDEEVMELMPQQMRDDLARAARAMIGFDSPKVVGACRIILNRHAVDHARAVLAKWGTPTPQPVPVSERLPGPDDVNEDGNCWMWDRESCFWDWTYIRTRTRAEMYTYTHWLPANALPTPEATNE